MSGVETAAAAAGLLTLAIQTFRGCVQAFEFFYSAEHIGVDGDFIRSTLQWEQCRLIEWGSRAGLDSTPNERLNWYFAKWILEQLETLLTSADKLKSRYRLEVTEEDITAEDLKAQNTPQQGLSKLISRLRPDVSTATARIIRANNSAIKRFRWAALGKDQATRILRDISELNNRLDKLLDSADQKQLKLMWSALLRDLVSRCTNSSEVDAVKELISSSRPASDQAIAAAASLKHIRLVIGADKREDEVKPPLTKETKNSVPPLHRLKIRKLSAYSVSTTLEYSGLEFAQYDGTAVMIEWKIPQAGSWLEHADKVKCLALLLGSMDDSSFHSLRCVGWLPYEERERYALVYDIPPDPRGASQTTWQTMSLYELISSQPQLSLSRRFQIAFDLAETVLQLHTAGWLHKGIRSENVMFFSPLNSNSGPEAFFQGQPYLVGYEYARPDTPTAAAMTELPDTTLHTDLYRHPKARGVHRQPYQKRFDMYALGCVLLELALWKHLVDIQSNYRKEDVAAVIAKAVQKNSDLELPSLLELPSQQEQLSEITHHVGETLTRAITLCLTMKPELEDIGEASLETQKEVVDRLRNCQC